MTTAHKKAPMVTELDWGPHPNGFGGQRATFKFHNGYGASVLFGGPFYTDNGTYEIAVTDHEGNLKYDTPITGDVLGYLSEAEANEALSAIASLPQAGAT